MLLLPQKSKLFRNTRTVIAGNSVWGPGTATINVTIPEYNVLTMTIWGGGGGGGGGDYVQNQYAAGAAGTSYFTAPDGTIYAYGGTGGYNFAGGAAAGDPNGVAGSPGGASGGNLYNTTGGGMAGGAGAGYNGYGTDIHGGRGGNGGLVGKQWAYGAPGAPVVGQTYTLYLAPSGAPSGGYYTPYSYAQPQQGTYPQAQLVWT